MRFVKEAFESNYIAPLGLQVDAFEREFAEYMGIPYAVAVSSGTAGRDILKYSKRPGGYVMLDGERFDIKAKVHQLTGYSAHADQKGLIEWVEAMPERPGKIKLVHGEAGAQKVLYRELGKRLKD